ncbi:hypothetical protein G8759_29865 [Spirosoma aureum]|uniref:Uncharacterized protein n=1 Tax=Spirosoma aureum TaxID=2692134 RepID=A0A6G9AVW7_9BACT|nr:hypothetical protein [Spirosoma aureum]QIP16550.1 hypothetical protein G8759_29865 [Spirosoma aureum]
MPPVRLADPILFGDVCSPQAETTINSCTGQPFGGFIRNLAGPSCMSVQAGVWSEASSWSCGRIPTSQDRVSLHHMITIPASYQAKANQLIYSSSGRLR